MNTNYFLYLNELPKEEKTEQLIAIVLFWIIAFAIILILQFLKYRYKDKTKSKIFQKFLERI